jgi:hypothetical protein
VASGARIKPGEALLHRSMEKPDQLAMRRVHRAA